MTSDDERSIRSPELDQTLAQSLAGIEIPPRPAILDQVMGEMQSDDPDYRRLATLITSDMGLSAWMIRTANAPVFGYRTKARTVRDALTMLGLLMVLRTVAGFSLRRSLPEPPALQGFWDGAARVAHLSAWLVRELGVADGVRAQEAYTFGLFRDCGIPVLMRVASDYAEVLAAARRDTAAPFTRIESDRIGLNHAIVGAALGRSWYLPEEHCDAILLHHDAMTLADGATGRAATARRLIAVAHLADRLQGCSQPFDREWDKLGAACLAALALDEASLAPLQAGARHVLSELP